MTEPIMIEGWACKLYPEGARGAVRQDGLGVLLHANGGFSGNDCYVPPAVMCWVLAPLLADRPEQAPQGARRRVLGGKGGQTVGLEPHWIGCPCRECADATKPEEPGS